MGYYDLTNTFDECGIYPVVDAAQRDAAVGVLAEAGIAAEPDVKPGETEDGRVDCVLVIAADCERAI